MKAIEIKNLRKEYKDTLAVDNLCLNIEKGELFSLLGVNGAGKTTTVKMLSGLTRPTSGDAYIFGKSILRDTTAVKEMIDISMQETAVARNLTVEENIDFLARLNGLEKQGAEEIKQKVLKDFSLNEIKNKRAGKLSGGQQRKLSIALSLISNPAVLFLDEPTLGLDVLARRELWQIINKIKQTTTVILTTHYMEEAEALSDRIGIMKEGKLLFCGTKEELFKKSQKTSVEEAFIKIVSGGEKDE